MIKKVFFLVLLLLLFITIGVGAFTQTTYFKEKFKEYLIAKSPLALHIGRLEGIFPFWMKAEEVTLQINTDSAVTIRESTFTLSPFTLLIQKLTFIHLHLKDVLVTANQTKTASLFCPTLPLAIEVYSLEIENLVYNTLPALDIHGSVDIAPCGGPFFLNLTIREQLNNHRILHLHLDADAITQTTSVVANLCQLDPETPSSALNLWTAGTLALQDKSFSGTLHGEGTLASLNKPWHVSSKIDLKPGQFLCRELMIAMNEIVIKGSLQGENKKLLFESLLAEAPLTAQAEWHFIPEERFLLSNLSLNYVENHITGEIAYSFPIKKIEAALEIEMPEIEKTADLLKKILDFEETLAGSVNMQLSLYDGEATCRAEVANFKWNDFSVSQGTFDSHWQKEKPLAFTLQVYDFDVLRPSYEVFPLVHVKAEGTLSDKIFKLVGSVGGFGEEPFSLECKIPTHLTLKPFSYSIDKQSPFFIRFSGHGSVDPLLAFLENASLIVQGDIDANLEISGLWEESRITGYFIFSDGTIQDLTTGAFFQNVTMKVQGEEEYLSITSLTAQDSGPGKIEGKGKIRWDAKEQFPFYIHFKTTHFLLFALDPFTATADAEIELSGNLKKVLIRGDATLVKGLITIPNKLPVTIPTLDVTYINPLPELSFDTALPPKFPIEVTWDVDVHIPRRLEIEGRGFYSEWRGEMKIEGRSPEVRRTGELTLIQGRFDFARHSFYLDKGKIKIEGIAAKEFYVDVEGKTEVETLVVFMNVKGYLNNTKMTFTSTPPMSIEQIFSRLLFDSNLNELTPFQACRLAKFLVTLSGKYASPSAFDNFKDSLGIDVFDITHCDIDAMDFTFQVGKYISQGTYVGINKSISGDFDSIEIQTRLYQDFFLQANYGGSLNGLTPNGGKIIFKWYKTY